MEENKFDFTEEETTSNADSTNTKQAVKQDAKGLWVSFKRFIHELLDFRHDTDRDATVEAIKGDIPFKGATAWILICSIFVASVGLNADSTAVVIGAMLISPLMGPILGIGMSLAINDIDTLKKSLINLAVMIVLSLITAFLFFRFFPSGTDFTIELERRTTPNIRDVLIAFFGGLALIIARTKKGTIATVIFGVAIATALMPPLCTAGYGLVVWVKGDLWTDWRYFSGAMFLFTINTIFIALATFTVLKILRFPMIKYANSKKRRFIARTASVVAILVMIPATWTFIKMLNKSALERDFGEFIENEVKSNRELKLLYIDGNVEDINPTDKTIELFFNGELANATIIDLENELKSYDNIKNYKLIINANKHKSYDKILEYNDRVIKELDIKDNTISKLRNEINELQQTIEELKEEVNQKSTAAESFKDLMKSVKIQFPDLYDFGYTEMPFSRNFSTVDSVSVAKIKWKSSVNDSIATLKEQELSTWLDKKLETKVVLLKE